MDSKRSWIAINRLKTKQAFGSIFPRDEKMVDAIANHMQGYGYDQSQPIIVWDRTKEEGNNNALYIVDGHTRKCAAAKARISPVYAARVKFASEEQALQYAIHNQRDRRNMTDADLLRCIQAMDSRKSRGGDRRSQEAKSKTSNEVIDQKKSSAEQTADIVGTSKTKVEKVRAIIDHADEQIKKDVETGNKTINKAYQETQQKRREQKNNQESLCERLPVSTNIKTGEPTEQIYLNSLAEDLSRHFGTKILIRKDGQKGKVEIEFYGRDDLERLIDRLKQYC